VEEPVRPAALGGGHVVRSAGGTPLVASHYNVLRVFFDGTPAAASFGATPGTAPVNFVQIYNQDMTYATAHANAPATVAQNGGSSASMTVQDLLDLASQKLLSISEP
jgi:hypothetical protein